MALIKQSHNVYLAVVDLDGLLYRLHETICEKVDNGEADAQCYMGAYRALDIIRHHEFVDTQDDFMRLFRRYAEDDTEGGAWDGPSGSDTGR